MVILASEVMSEDDISWPGMLHHVLQARGLEVVDGHPADVRARGGARGAGLRGHHDLFQGEGGFLDAHGEGGVVAEAEHLGVILESEHLDGKGRVADGHFLQTGASLRIRDGENPVVGEHAGGADDGLFVRVGDDCQLQGQGFRPGLGARRVPTKQKGHQDGQGDKVNSRFFIMHAISLGVFTKVAFIIDKSNLI